MARGRAARPASQEEPLRGMLPGMLLCSRDDVHRHGRHSAGREKFSVEANQAKERMEKVPELLEAPAWGQRGLRGEFGSCPAAGFCWQKLLCEGGNQMGRMLLSWKGRGCDAEDAFLALCVFGFVLFELGAVEQSWGILTPRKLCCPHLKNNVMFW